MARRSGTLKLDKLLIYSDLYNLGLTAVDITHLQEIFDKYKGTVNYEYIYKPATTGYDIILSAGVSDDTPSIDIRHRDRELPATAPYPLFMIDRAEYIYFTYLPDPKTIIMTEEIGWVLNSMLRGIDRNHTDRLISSDADLKKKVIDNMKSYPSDYYHTLNTALVDIFYICAGQTPPKIQFKKGQYDGMPDYVQHIIAVLQLPATDTRIAFYVSKRMHSYYYGRTNGYDINISFYVTEVGDQVYNWTDPQRYISHIGASATGGHYDAVPRVFYLDPFPILPSSKDVIDAHRRGKGILTIDNATLDLITKRWVRKQQDLENEKLAIQQLEKKLESKIKALDAGSEFSYNDITFRKNEFEYEGQILACPQVEMKDVLAKFSGHYSEDHLNFDRVLAVWMSNVTTLVLKSTTPIKGTIGDVTFEVRHVQKKAKNSVITHTYYVNDKRINKDEVPDVLGRAICFPDTDSFNEFCETVAKCSLRYHKFLASGIQVTAHDEIFNQRTEFQISLVREKNKNYLVFNGKRFKISNTNKLLSIANAGNMSRIIDILLDPDVAGLSGDDMKQLIEIGRKTLIEQRQKEEELLSNTMDMFGITVLDEYTAQNGKILSGYLIKGALRDYIVERRDLLVYEYPSGRYICMVDKGQNEHTNTARLVNRFFALSNDSKLAKEITTL